MPDRSPLPEPDALDGVNYLTTEQAAEVLGDDVTVDMIEDWVRRKILKPAGRHPGRSNVYREDDVYAAEKRTRLRRTRPRRSHLPKSSEQVHDLGTDAAVDATQNQVTTCGISESGKPACDQPADPDLPFNVCTRHLAEIHLSYQTLMTAKIRANGARGIATSHEYGPPRPEHVYYLRLGDQLKIGFSTNVAQRINEIHHDELLAVEPGGRKLEQMRHKQFQAARVYRNREWFRLTDELRSHVAMLVDHFGPPGKVLGWKP